MSVVFIIIFLLIFHFLDEELLSLLLFLIFILWGTETFIWQVLDWSCADNASFKLIIYLKCEGRGPRGVMVKAMDCGIVVSKSVLQSGYYVHFRANTFGKGMNPLILPAMG